MKYFRIFCLGILASAQPTISAQDSEPAESTEVAAEAPEVDPVVAMRDEIDQLSTESRLQEIRIKAELAEKIQETQRLKIEAEYRRAQNQAAIADLQAERQALEAKLALEKSKSQAEMAELKHENEMLELQIEKIQRDGQRAVIEVRAQAEALSANFRLKEEQAKAELAAKELERRKLLADIEMLNVENKRKEAELKSSQLEVQTETLRIDLRRKELLTTNEEANLKLAELKRVLEIRSQEQKLRDSLDLDDSYTSTPYDGETLTVSDRRIPLNGPIITGTANFITERIHFLNNQDSEAPIFIVIDSCPGGSVMEGYRILKAMEASDAPVHVVVKSFAASMAAVILTMAEHSYAFPNAVILHHQPFSFSVGNLTQQSEQMEIFNQWAERLHKPVADKMGVSLEDFYEEMYKNNSDGDWQEFADTAQELKWVDHIIEELREEGIRERPGTQAPMPFIIFAGSDEESVASEVKSQIPVNAYIPAPGPFDFYFLYNRNGFYRWPSL